MKVRTDAPPVRGDELTSVPVFPLPRVVFFPRTLLPLHLFEPRYRRMITDCTTTGPDAMVVTLLADGWESDYEGRPPIHKVASVGRIVGHEARDDGTHDIVLQGTARVHLEELPSRGDEPYRRAHATILDDVGGDAVPRAEITALLACAQGVAAAIQHRHPGFTLGVGANDPAARIADTLADRLVSEPALRQKILETLDVPKRVGLVTEAVSELYARLNRGGPAS